jgi:hypothetical protein
MSRCAQFLEDNCLAITPIKQPQICPNWRNCSDDKPLTEHDHGPYWQLRVRRTGSDKLIRTADDVPRPNRKYGLLVDYWAPKGDRPERPPTPDEMVTYLAYIAQLPESEDKILLLPSSVAKGILARASGYLGKLRRNFNTFFKKQELEELQKM